MKILTASFLLLLSIGSAWAQDYEREKRWADEVVPGIVVGEPLWLETSAGRKFLAIHAPVIGGGKGALVIVHGIGVHPDHGVIGVLRSKLHDMGWTTLSVQMPVLAADAKADAYPAVFPEAIDRIGLAAGWLRSRGAIKVVLVSHSLGSWMSNSYLDATPQSPILAWVCMGLSGGYSWATYFSRRPIFDIYGEHDLGPVTGAAWRRAMTLRTTVNTSRQVVIPGADHFYARKEDELARAIDGWLATALR